MPKNRHFFLEETREPQTSFLIGLRGLIGIVTNQDSLYNYGIMESGTSNRHQDDIGDYLGHLYCGINKCSLRLEG